MAYYVKNRYSPGSPSMVGRGTALSVAADERSGHRHAIEGLYGEELRQRAERLGLRGIVEEVYYKGDTRYAHDLITDETLVLTGPQLEVIKMLAREPGSYILGRLTVPGATIWHAFGGKTEEIKGARLRKAVDELRRTGLLVEVMVGERPAGMAGHWQIVPWLGGA